jgi:hypothetical protein
MLWLIPESLYCPLLCGDLIVEIELDLGVLCGDLIVEIELDLGDCSEWIMVERDLALFELHNRDVSILCGWSNFEKKSCVFVSLILIYFLFLFKLCSYLEFDLTLDLNHRV